MVGVLLGRNLRENHARVVSVQNDRIQIPVSKRNLRRQVLNDSFTTAFIPESFVGVRGV